MKNFGRLICQLGLGALLGLAPKAQSQTILDQVDDAMFVAGRNEWWRIDLSGLLDLEGYYIDQRPPGLVFSSDQFFFNPRLSLFLDSQFGPHLYSLVQARFDRGFDPGLKPDGDARFDEYLMRYTPFSQPIVNLQLGKFSTVVGNWVPRHLSWDNPFINAPLPYENVLGMTDGAAPVSSTVFLNRRLLADRKTLWLPIIWGPSYATGGSIFGSTGSFDYGAEIKNASISSRPSAWDAFTIGFEAPTVSARVGYRPNAAWNIGFSGSAGSYLLPDAETDDIDRDHFQQYTLAHDLSYSWKHWQFFAEIFLTRFQVPHVGDADTLAYYLEGKYKVTSQLFLAARWNQQFFGKVDDPSGGSSQWDHQTWRTDAAVGYRFTRHLQAKVQYSYSHQQARFQQGEQLAAVQATLKF